MAYHRVIFRTEETDYWHDKAVGWREEHVDHPDIDFDREIVTFWYAILNDFAIDRIQRRHAAHAANAARHAGTTRHDPVSLVGTDDEAEHDQARGQTIHDLTLPENDVEDDG